jgi:hypothetical protein
MKKVKENVEDMSPEDLNFLALLCVTIALRKQATNNDFFQWQLARRLNINGTLLSKYLRGRRPMPQNVKEKLIRYLGIDKTLDAMEVNQHEVNPRKASSGRR